MRLIDADALAKAFREAAETDDSKDNRTYWSEALISAAEEADDAPTVDAVVVVRCKDCSHTNARSKDGEYWHCVVFNLWMGEDFFCADGERRSE